MIKKQSFKQKAKALKEETEKSSDGVLGQKDEQVRIAFILTREERERLKKYASDKGMTVTAVIRRRLSSIIE